jgi:hypothetical protein
VIASWVAFWDRREAPTSLSITRLWVALGVALHLGIATTVQLGIFPFGMLDPYPISVRLKSSGRYFCVFGYT